MVIPPSIALELLDSTSNYLYSTIPSSFRISKSKLKEQHSSLLQLLDMTGVGYMVKRLDRCSSISEVNAVEAMKVFKAWYKIILVFNLMNSSTSSSSSSSSSSMSEADSQLLEEYLKKYTLMETVLKCPMATPLTNHSLSRSSKSNLQIQSRGTSVGLGLPRAMQMVDRFYNSLDTHYNYCAEFIVSKSLLKHVIRELKSCMLQTTNPNSSSNNINSISSNDSNEKILTQWQRALRIYRSLLHSLLVGGLNTDYTFVSKRQEVRTKI